jgi:hypothetical protein
MTTDVPTAPWAGAMLVILGVTRYALLLRSLPEDVVTVTNPVSPDGTRRNGGGEIGIGESTLKEAAVPLN